MPPAAPGAVRRIADGFKTQKPMGGMVAAKAPKVPMAGRLSPTGKKVGGTPAPTAPRIPGPVKPPVAKPALASKAIPLRRVLSNTRRANGKFGYVTTVKKGHTMSEREYVVSKAGRLGMAEAAQGARRAMTRMGVNEKYTHKPGLPAGARENLNAAKYIATNPRARKGYLKAVGRNVKRTYKSPEFRRELTRRVEENAALSRRVGMAPVGEGGAAQGLITRAIMGRKW